MKTVILASGFGSRLWPISSSDHPKQFQPLINGQSLVRYTYDMMLKVTPAPELYVQTLKGLEHFVKEQIPGIDPNNVLTVPERRNTLPHTVWALSQITDIPDEPVLFRGVDHFVVNVDPFIDTLKTFINSHQSSKSSITLLCAPYKSYNSNDGYVAVDSSKKVKDFVEKPTKQSLEELANHSTIYRATFMYSVSRAGMLTVIEKSSDTWKQNLRDILSLVNAADKKKAFLDLPFMDISSAIFQKSKSLEVAEIDYNFIDIGRFEEVYAMNTRDSDGNVLLGPTVLGAPCKNNLIINKTKTPLVVMSINDSVIIQSDAGTLVSSFDASSKIGEIYKSQIHGTKYER